MDIVFLHGLRVDTVIGIWDWERQFKQTLVLDLDLGTDITPAACSDSIHDTLDYKAVSKRVAYLVENGGFLLVEALAENITSTLFAEFAVSWIRLRINKKSALRQVRDVGILIERTRPTA